jgi:branched-chain amino acid transport system substrate-binding protein
MAGSNAACRGARRRAFATRAATALAALLGAVACDGQRPVVVGVAMGEGESNGVRLAFEDARAAGLTEVDTFFVHADNNRAAPALEAAELFVAAPGVVAVVGHSNSAASISASQIYNDHAVVQLAPHSTAPLYSQAGPYSFRMVQSDDRQGAFLAELLQETHPGARLAVLYVNDDYGRGLRQAFLNALAPDRPAPVLDLPHLEAADSAAVARLSSAAVAALPDVIVWLGRADVLRRALPHLRTGLGTVPIFGGDNVEGALTHGTGERWQGVSYVGLVDMTAGGRLADFVRRFTARWGRQPTSPEALSYDAMAVLLAAMADGARTGSEVRAWLQDLGRGRPVFEGITGPVTFEEDGDLARTYVLRSMRRPGS